MRLASFFRRGTKPCWARYRCSAAAVAALLSVCGCAAEKKAPSGRRIEPVAPTETVRVAIDPLNPTRFFAAFVSARGEFIVFDGEGLGVRERLKVEGGDYGIVTALGGSDGYALINDTYATYALGGVGRTIAHGLDEVGVVYPARAVPELILKSADLKSVAWVGLDSGMPATKTLRTGTQVLVDWVPDADEFLAVGHQGQGYYWGAAAGLFEDEAPWPRCSDNALTAAMEDGEVINRVAAVSESIALIATGKGRVLIMERGSTPCGSTVRVGATVEGEILALAVAGREVFLRTDAAILARATFADGHLQFDWQRELAGDSAAPIRVADDLIIAATGGTKEVDSVTGAVVASEPATLTVLDGAGATQRRVELDQSFIDTVEAVFVDAERAELIFVINAAVGKVRRIDLGSGAIHDEDGNQLVGVLDRL